MKTKHTMHDDAMIFAEYLIFTVNGDLGKGITEIRKHCKDCLGKSRTKLIKYMEGEGYLIVADEPKKHRRHYLTDKLFEAVEKAAEDVLADTPGARMLRFLGHLASITNKGPLRKDPAILYLEYAGLPPEQIEQGTRIRDALLERGLLRKASHGGYQLTRNGHKTHRSKATKARAFGKPDPLLHLRKRAGAMKDRLSPFKDQAKLFCEAMFAIGLDDGGIFRGGLETLYSELFGARNDKFLAQFKSPKRGLVQSKGSGLYLLLPKAYELAGRELPTPASGSERPALDLSLSEKELVSLLLLHGETKGEQFTGDLTSFLACFFNGRDPRCTRRLAKKGYLARPKKSIYMWTKPGLRRIRAILKGGGKSMRLGDTPRDWERTVKRALKKTFLLSLIGLSGKSGGPIGVVREDLNKLYSETFSDTKEFTERPELIQEMIDSGLFEELKSDGDGPLWQITYLGFVFAGKGSEASASTPDRPLEEEEVNMSDLAEEETLEAVSASPTPEVPAETPGENVPEGWNDLIAEERQVLTRLYDKNGTALISGQLGNTLSKMGLNDGQASLEKMMRLGLIRELASTQHLITEKGAEIAKQCLTLRQAAELTPEDMRRQIRTAVKKTGRRQEEAPTGGGTAPAAPPGKPSRDKAIALIRALNEQVAWGETISRGDFAKTVNKLFGDYDKSLVAWMVGRVYLWSLGGDYQITLGGYELAGIKEPEPAAPPKEQLEPVSQTAKEALAEEQAAAVAPTPAGDAETSPKPKPAKTRQARNHDRIEKLKRHIMAENPNGFSNSDEVHKKCFTTGTDGKIFRTLKDQGYLANPKRGVWEVLPKLRKELGAVTPAPPEPKQPSALHERYMDHAKDFINKWLDLEPSGAWQGGIQTLHEKLFDKKYNKFTTWFDNDSGFVEGTGTAGRGASYILTDAAFELVRRKRQTAPAPEPSEARADAVAGQMVGDAGGLVKGSASGAPVTDDELTPGIPEPDGDGKVEPGIIPAVDAAPSLDGHMNIDELIDKKTASIAAKKELVVEAHEAIAETEEEITKEEGRLEQLIEVRASLAQLGYDASLVETGAKDA